MLKLEVGKKYKNKDGDIRQIVAKRNVAECIYPFVDDYHDTYNENGMYVSGGSAWDLVEEVIIFDMKTQPWFIRVNADNFNFVKDWVNSKGFVVSFSFDTDTMTYITNADVYREISHCSAMYGATDIENRAKEIKLNLKTILESVEYPEVDKEEAERIAIRKEMEALAERLKALEGN